MDLLDELLEQDGGGYMRGALLRELEASGRQNRVRQFAFDVFDVDLDFRKDIAEVHDVLEAERSQTYPLAVLWERLRSSA